MNIYGLNNRAYKYYIKNVKGNKNISYIEAKKKLTRNILLAFKFPQSEEDKRLRRQVYAYGNLTIVVQGNRIIDIHNKREPSDWFWLNEKLKNELNEKLGIGEENTRKVG